MDKDTDTVTIVLSRDFAEDLSLQIADHTCWIGGVAWGARGDTCDPYLPDSDLLREMQIKLKQQLGTGSLLPF